MAQEKVGIVVLNYRNYDDTIACLQSLARITYPNIETIVVDNDSRNDSLARISRDLAARQAPHAAIEESAVDAAAGIPEKTVLVQALRNRGYAAGNNLGIRVALARGADYVLILNNDTLVEPGFLEPLVAYARSREKVGAVGPKVVDTQGNIDTACARRRLAPGECFFRVGMGRRLFPNNRWTRRPIYRGEYGFDAPREVDVLSGSCMLLKSSALRTVGLLDENTFLFLEEFILHEKFREAGLASAVVPASRIVHKYGQSTSGSPSACIDRARRESLRYYLTHYRHYPRFIAEVLLLLTRSPKAFFQKRLPFCNPAQKAQRGCRS